MIPSHPYYLLSSTEELKSICKTYHDRIVSLENLKYDFEYVVKRKDVEVHTITKSYIQNYNFFLQKKFYSHCQKYATTTATLSQFQNNFQIFKTKQQTKKKNSNALTYQKTLLFLYFFFNFLFFPTKKKLTTRFSKF